MEKRVAGTRDFFEFAPCGRPRPWSLGPRREYAGRQEGDSRKKSRVRYAAKRDRVSTGIHILRHTFCAHLAMQGTPMRGVQELVGHQRLAVTQRYSHLTPAPLDSTIRLPDNRRQQASGNSWAPPTE